MNILLICDEYPPGKHGGIGTAVRLQANALSRLGHNVYVAGLYEWGYGEQDMYDDNGVQVFRFRMGLASGIFKKQDALWVRALYKLLHLTGIFQWDIQRSLKKYKKEIEALISRHKIDIIEMPDFHNYRRYCKNYVEPVRFTVPTIVKVHGSITYIAKENSTAVPAHIYDMEKQMFQNASAICSVSKYGGDKVKKYFELDNDYHVIHNGIDTAKLTPVDVKDEHKVVFTGTLNENKGIYQLMKAWNIVADKNKNARLHIYGKGPVQKIKSLLSANAKDTVQFLGHVDHATLFHELGTAGVCIFPSYAENFALAPMEAMASGAAIVYTKRASGAELINDGVDGLLVDPDDVEGIADSILKLLSNKNIRDRIAKMGQEKVVKEFDINVIAREHIDYYTSILANNK